MQGIPRFTITFTRDDKCYTRCDFLEIRNLSFYPKLLTSNLKPTPLALITILSPLITGQKLHSAPLLTKEGRSLCDGEVRAFE